MSLGNPKVIVRFEQGLLDLIERTIEDRNGRTKREPWTLSDFIRDAVREKLDHMRRARRRRPSSLAATDDSNSGTSFAKETDNGGP